MAATTTLQFLQPSVSPHTLQPSPHPPKPTLQIAQTNFPNRKSSIKCASKPQLDLPEPKPDSDPDPEPEPEQNQEPEDSAIEKRRKKSVITQRRMLGLEKAEPPNFEIGWKRTKETILEKPKGYVIADFLEKLEGLMGRQYGSTELLAKAGEIVAERAREEAEVLREKGEVEEKMITELYRVLRLMEMDLEMVKAAVKEETLAERLEQAKARCRQAILVANSF